MIFNCDFQLYCTIDVTVNLIGIYCLQPNDAKAINKLISFLLDVVYRRRSLVHVGTPEFDSRCQLYFWYKLCVKIVQRILGEGSSVKLRLTRESFRCTTVKFWVLFTFSGSCWRGWCCICCLLLGREKEVRVTNSDKADLFTIIFL